MTLHPNGCPVCTQPWRVSYSIIDQTTGRPVETFADFCERTDPAELLRLVRTGGGRPGMLGARLEYRAWEPPDDGIPNTAVAI